MTPGQTHLHATSPFLTPFVMDSGILPKGEFVYLRNPFDPRIRHLCTMVNSRHLPAAVYAELEVMAETGQVVRYTRYPLPLEEENANR